MDAVSTTNLTDGMHVLADALLKNGIDKMYGVVGIPVTDVARIRERGFATSVCAMRLMPATRRLPKAF